MTTLKDMISIILEKTQAGKLDWQQLANSSYLAGLGDMSIEISRRSNQDTVLVLRNGEGSGVESVGYNNLDSPWDDNLLALYEAARRRALGADSLLQSLKDKLGKL